MARWKAHAEFLLSVNILYRPMRRRSDSLKADLCHAQQHDLKTIAPLSHRPIVLTDTIDYRTMFFALSS